MKIKFNVDDTLLKGARRLGGIFGFEESDDGVPLYAVCDEKIGASLKDGVGTIYYAEKYQFFRELGVFIQNAKEKSEFEIFEDTYFKTKAVMIDASRCGVPNVKSIKKIIDYLAAFGYNMIMLYTEDTVELESRPYFGYMRGRYTKEELMSVDDYAFEYGIEAIPCIECYGHMGKYLLWSEAFEIKDTDEVLLAREEKTFEFLEELIKTVSSCYRSNRIHVGMDEAFTMGRGRFLDKHGFVPRFDVFNDYMDRLMEITNKLGLKPMMWSDMYFRGYYKEDGYVPEDTKERIPKDVQLVFWHYGEVPYCDEYALRKHCELNRDVIFAGGLWSWMGHFPENNYAYDMTEFSLSACRKTGVKEMIVTIWTNDNAECDYFANLIGLSFSAELCYNENVTKEELKSRFEFCTGGDFNAFMDMSQYQNIFDEEHKYESFHDRFAGKALFWQDIMEGLFDTHLFENPMSGHYREYAEKMKAYSGKWDYLYKFAQEVFDYLAIKCEIAEKAVPSYLAGDRETLKYISETLLPKLIIATETVHKSHKAMWFENNKIVGWSNLDIRYGGVKARCETAKMLIDSYLSGESDKIEEFEVKRLDRPYNGFLPYCKMATPIGRI